MTQTSLLRRLKQRARVLRENWRIGRFEQRAGDLWDRSRPEPRALLLPAAGVGSLGDEAMLVASGRILRDHGVTRITILSYGPGEPWQAKGDFTDVISLGTDYSQNFWQTCEIILEACATSTHMLIQGADVMDGFYSPQECVRRTTYARIAAAAGLRTTIGGFSYNDSPHQRTVSALADTPETVRLVARDPVSWGRLQSRITRDVKLGADMAFLLQPAVNGPNLETCGSWIAQEKSDGRIVLGVNANYLVAPGHRAEDMGQALISAYADGLAPLLSDDTPVSLLLIPHDVRAMVGRYNDHQLLQAIADHLPADQSPHIHVVDPSLVAAEAKTLAGQVDLVLSGRMHLAIAALGQGVPAAGVTYQGKFEGLYQHFQLGGLTLTPEALLAGDLTAFMRRILADREALSAQIAARLPAVTDLARVSFHNLVGEVSS